MKLEIPDTLRITNPRWVKKMETRKTWEEVNNKCEIDGKTLNISEYRCCIVGEALDLWDKSWDGFRLSHGGISYGGDLEVKYHGNCRKCSDWSNALFHEVEDLGRYNDTDVESLEIQLEKFAKHLEVQHPEYIENARRRNAKD